MEIKEAQPLSSRRSLMGKRREEHLGEGRGWFPVSQQRKWLSKQMESRNEPQRGGKDARGRVGKLFNISRSLYLLILKDSGHWALLFPRHQWGNRVSERFSDLPKVIQLYVAEACWIKSHQIQSWGKTVWEVLFLLAMMGPSGPLLLPWMLLPRAAHKDRDWAPNPQVCPHLYAGHQAGLVLLISWQAPKGIFPFFF